MKDEALKDSNDTIVRFHFVSGKTLEVSYTPSKFDEFISNIKKGWTNASCTGRTFGINFSLVLYYEVKE
jgi:hypothetical protein